MDKQVSQFIMNDQNLSHTLTSSKPFHNANFSSSQLDFTIKRKRSLTSLNTHTNKTQSIAKYNKTPSPKHVNKPVSLTSALTLKDNNYLKPSVLHEKFHQLSLNPSQKKPLKLRISKLNNQNPSNLLKQQFNDFSKQLESKFLDQNKIIKHSLQKIQKLVINHAKSPLSQTNKETQISNKKGLDQGVLNKKESDQVLINKKGLDQVLLSKNGRSCLKGSKKQRGKEDEQQQKQRINKIHSINSVREQSQSLSSQSNRNEELKRENEKLRHKIRQLMEDNQRIAQLMLERQDILKDNKQLIDKNKQLVDKNKQLTQQNKELTQQNKELLQGSKQYKTINSFLASQNYRLSLQLSFLKDKILQYEQKQYEDAMTDSEKGEQQQNAISDSQTLTESKNKGSQQNGLTMSEHKGQQQIGLSSTSLMNESQTNQQKQYIQDQSSHSHSLLKSSQYESKQNLNSKEIIPSKQLQISQSRILIKQIKTENFSLLNKQIDQEEPFTITQMKSFKNLQLGSSLENHIAKLSQKIEQLQQQLLQQKDANQNLSNKLAVLKLQQHGVKRQSKRYHKQNQSLDSVVSIKINLQSQDPSDCPQQNSQHLKKTASFHQSIVKTKRSQPSLENIPHKVSKSKILSNQIIYFAQTLETQKQPHNSAVDIKQSGYQQKNDMNQTRRDQSNILGTIKQQDEDEKKKTLCMKKLQIPAEQIRKRRKSMSQQLNISLQKKGNPKKNLNNSLSFYSKQKIAQLQMLKQTISLKFEAFKYTYELFQSQMILWPNKTVTTKDLKSILSEYPFLLEESSIEILLSYCDASDTDGIGVDIFCNKMREFITEYSDLTEQEELILEKKILKRWKYTSQQILDLMRKLETVSGEITKEAFMSVFQEFKFEENEIHHLLSQSVAISPDLNRIKYKHYLENFLAKN